MNLFKITWKHRDESRKILNNNKRDNIHEYFPNNVGTSLQKKKDFNQRQIG